MHPCLITLISLTHEFTMRVIN